jgi:hypothetical protein
MLSLYIIVLIRGVIDNKIRKSAYKHYLWWSDKNEKDKNNKFPQIILKNIIINNSILHGITINEAEIIRDISEIKKVFHIRFYDKNNKTENINPSGERNLITNSFYFQIQLKKFPVLFLFKVLLKLFLYKMILLSNITKTEHCIFIRAGKKTNNIFNIIFDELYCIKYNISKINN